MVLSGWIGKVDFVARVDNYAREDHSHLTFLRKNGTM